MRVLWLVTLAAVLQAAAPAKILSILPGAVRSHSILYDRLLKELASRGHQITYITPFKSKQPTQNITEVIIPDFKDHIPGGGKLNPQLLGTIGPVLPWLMILSMPYMAPKINSLILEEPEVQKLIERDDFDLIFGEPYMDESVISGFAYKNKAPIVTLSTFMQNMWSGYVAGNPSPASYIPDPFLAYSSNMTFLQRLNNLVYTLFGELVHQVTLYLDDLIMREHFGSDLPGIKTLLKNTSLLLVNHHPSLSFARPQAPNTIDVAGMHIYPPKPLPKDLEEYMSNSKNGVILFSMGTNVNSSDLGEERIEGILKAFSRLDENIIWKFEKELDNLPKNVKIATWLPQSDLLAHPNLKLFITHGGLLSTTEAVFRGVPIVGIPVLADQPMNMKQTENVGLGITLSLADLSEETLYTAVKEVLTNPKYRDTAKQRSKLLHDNMSPPLETAVWWIEYILRHNGAPHLRPASQDLSWLQLHQFDTIAALTIILGAIAYLDFLVLRKIYRRLCKKSVSVEKKNN